jgi:hypothetical protein
MAFAAIQRRRRRSAAFAAPGTRLARPDRGGVVTGLPLLLLRSEGVALLAMAMALYGVLPATLGMVGLVTETGVAVALALVWFAHIGMDRALGLGLQCPDGSGRTHLRGDPWTA